MNRLTTFLKRFFAIIILLAFILLTLPKISFNAFGQDINFNPVDDFLIPQGILISDFRKGEGLYQTNIIRAYFPVDTSEEIVNVSLSLIKNRINTANG